MRMRALFALSLSLAVSMHDPQFAAAQEPVVSTTPAGSGRLFGHLLGFNTTELVLPDISSVAPEDCDGWECQRRWKFRAIPYGWVPGCQGDIGGRRVTASVDVSIGDTLNVMFNHLNAVGLGQFEATNGRFGMIFNGIYADVSPGKEFRHLDFSSRLRLALFDLTGTVELPALAERMHLPCGSRFELLAGARFDSFSGDVTVTGPRGNSDTFGGTDDWFDMIVGARMRVPLGRCLTAQVRGDVGGFGLGEASRFTWNVEATLEYRLSPCLSMFAGYRWLDIDHHSGGPRDFHFNLTLNGPLVGFAFDF